MTFWIVFTKLHQKVFINDDKVYKGFACAFFVFPNQRFPQGMLLVLHAAVSHHGIVENLMVSDRGLRRFRENAFKRHHKRQGL